MKPLTTIRPYLTKVAIIATLFFFALVTNVAWSQWSEPQEKPTGGNTPAPLNESGSAQVKSGFLWIGSGMRASNIAIGACPFGACPFGYETFQLPAGNNFRFQVGGSESAVITGDGNVLARNIIRGGQARAGSYCNFDGGDCISAGTLQWMAQRIVALESAPAPSCTLETVSPGGCTASCPTGSIVTARSNCDTGSNNTISGAALCARIVCS